MLHNILVFSLASLLTAKNDTRASRRYRHKKNKGPRPTTNATDTTEPNTLRARPRTGVSARRNLTRENSKHIMTAPARQNRKLTDQQPTFPGRSPPLSPPPSPTEDAPAYFYESPSHVRRCGVEKRDDKYGDCRKTRCLRQAEAIAAAASFSDINIPESNNNQRRRETDCTAQPRKTCLVKIAGVPRQNAHEVGTPDSFDTPTSVHV